MNARKYPEPYPICAKCRQDIKGSKPVTANDGATFHKGCWNNTLPSLPTTAELNTLRAENQRLKVAVRLAAHPENYQCDSTIDSCLGCFASAALRGGGE